MHTGHHDVELTVRSILDKQEREPSFAGTCNDAAVAQTGAVSEEAMAIDNAPNDTGVEVAIPNLQQLDLEPACTERTHGGSKSSDPTPKLGGGTTLTAGTASIAGGAMASPSMDTTKVAPRDEADGAHWSFEQALQCFVASIRWHILLAHFDVHSPVTMCMIVKDGMHSY